ncbi:MAG: DUF3151 domain-containing protein [Acidimicrobiales bacterium]
MTEMRPVNLSTSGPPETVLPEEPAVLRHALAQAQAAGASQRERTEELAAQSPRSSVVWAALGQIATSPIEAYAFYRVGYHRGLDTLRGNGWKGSGYVRWQHPSNRGFLLCLSGLAQCAALIGEFDEAERCELFLRQCDPNWPPADFSD